LGNEALLSGKIGRRGLFCGALPETQLRNFRNDQEYLMDFFEHAPIGFHAFGPDRLIIDMNHTELDMLGYTKEEVIWKKTWPPDC
jgi:PAS domain-containing protein